MSVRADAMFGQLLKNLRLEAGLTQEGLAERAGLSTRGIQDLERGVTRPLKDTARRLIAALSLGGEERARFEAAAGPAPRRRRAATEPAPAPLPANPVPASRLVHLTTLIGRESELGQIGRMLGQAEVRLLTLTGPGGIGKTRLALAAAEGLHDLYVDGTIFVGLATLHDSALVGPAIAQALQIREAPIRPLGEQLIEQLRQKRLLLILDNFEHVLGAATLLADLLQACPSLRCLVTSRIALRVRGEHEFSVPPLAVAALAAGPNTVRQSAAVTLFLDRARAVDPAFAVSEAHGALLTSICERLDGLPLAIELAAARIKYLSPQALLARIDHRLTLLTGGARDLPPRQQTLRQTIAWSYDLLDGDEQRLFRQISVFAGGCSLEAATAVCTAGGGADRDVFPLLEALVAANLLRTEVQADGEPRFLLLETIREFGYEQVVAAGSPAALQRRHVDYFCALAETAERNMTGSETASWADRLEREHDNLRAALEWTVTAGDAETGLRLAGALWRFWYLHAHLTEGRRRLEAILALPDPGKDAVAARAKALYGAGVLALEQGQSVRVAGLMEEALQIYRARDESSGIAATLNLLALAEREQGRYERARDLHEESLERARAAGDRRGVAKNLSNLGIVARLLGNYAAATSLYAESLAIYRELQDGWGVAALLTNLAEVARDERHYGQAGMVYRESLSLHRQLGHKQGVAECLEGLAWVAGADGRLEAAARLFGAAEALRQAIGVTGAAVERGRVYYDLIVLLASPDHGDGGDLGPPIGDEGFARAWEAGARLTHEEAIDEALADHREHLPLDLLEESFDRVAVRGDDLVAHFYDQVFARDPALRGLFTGVAMGAQKAKFLSTLMALRRSWRHLEQFVPELEALGARHRRYGVLQEHYPLIGEALVSAIRETAGKDWKPDYAPAWREAFMVVQTIMLRGAATAQAREMAGNPRDS